MYLSLWYGVWSGILCGLWVGAGVAVLKQRQEAKRRAWNEPEPPNFVTAFETWVKRLRTCRDLEYVSYEDSRLWNMVVDASHDIARGLNKSTTSASRTS